MTSLDVRSANHRSGKTIEKEVFEQVFGKLERLPVNENTLERPEMCGTGLFYEPYQPDPDLPPLE